MARDVPFCFMFFPLYAKFKSLQTSLYSDYYSSISTSFPGSSSSSSGMFLKSPSVSRADAKEPFFVGLTSGLLAGAVAGAIVTPADMLKTRIQQGLAGESTGFFAYASQVVPKKDGQPCREDGTHVFVSLRRCMVSCRSPLSYRNNGSLRRDVM